jgi:hypothetical protein
MRRSDAHYFGIWRSYKVCQSLDIVHVTAIVCIYQYRSGFHLCHLQNFTTFLTEEEVPPQSAQLLFRRLR